MKYKAFKRLVVQIIPEPDIEEVSPGGIIKPRTATEPKNIAFGKVLDGTFFRVETETCTKSHAEALVKPGDTVAFSKAGALNDKGLYYFLSEEQVLAVVED